MRATHAQFQDNLKRARDIAGLARNLAAQTTVALDVSDLYRASLVLGVSALDNFIHEITRKGMLEVAAGTRIATDAYSRFAISLASVSTMLANPGRFQTLDDEIRERHGFLSFQDPNRVADAIRLISAKELWKEVGQILGVTNIVAKSQLKLIVDRRNQIAHEADMDPAAPGFRWPIDSLLVDDALAVIDSTAAAIFSVVITP